VSHGAGGRRWVRGRRTLVPFEPVLESGPDADPYPGLLPPVVGEHAEQTGPLLDVPRRRLRQECAMDTLFTKVAGLDVHLKGIQCAVRCCQESGKLIKQVRSFGTMTGDLRALADYLQSLGVTHVAMEATGVLWKPVWNVLEGRFTLLLVNPRHLKKVPGRKTDVTDAEWIAQLLQYGLLRGSFVPARPLRDLRDLTRHRAQLAGEHTRVANRIHKLLEDANIKLGSVASDVLGKSGRKMLQALLNGERDPAVLANMALGALRDKIPQLTRALDGHCTEHHRYMLGRLLSHLGYLEGQSEQFDQRIGRRLGELLANSAYEQLDRIPGVNRRMIENVIAEIGVDMTIFPDEHHLASWTGICPGNEESAGKRLRSRTRKGNRWLRRALAEAAWAASRTKNSYFRAQFRRLASKRGKKRALVAVGHALLVVIYHVLKHGVEYSDLGPDYFDRLEPERLRRYLVKRLQGLGYDVMLTPRIPDASMA
jgi:transposase